MTALRCAIAGTGTIGRHHAKVAITHPGLELAALIDTSPEAAARAADEAEAATGVRPVTASTIEDALAATAFDLVAICTPSGLHVDLATAALAAGKHVVIEKPLDANMSRARQLAALARESGLVVSVISQHRFDPASRVVAQAAHDGEFGTLTSGLASVAWYRSQDYYDSGGWRGTWALDGGGAVMNQGVHTVDLLVWTLGRPVEITGSTALLGHERIEVEDTAVATVRFASGALGVLHCTTAAYPGLSARYQVHGTRGSAIVDNDELAYFHVAPRDSPLASASATSGNNAAEGVVDQKAERLPPEHVADQPDRFLRQHSRQYDDIVAAIREGRAPAVTVDDALLALAVVRGLYVSAALGSPVLVDDILDGRYDDAVPTVRAAGASRSR
ncbi:Gfo/Idh/MocA family oxidoreductase [Amycolatopsis acidicola]|uniref:Gfo/Idh/MocA family oxidoreductase n=1 Tax=Amycolatopsis acidicola TaxID=2596893 RepID=A0A5N0VJH2_9PSEU|nr:Gfo/Idh/MocA family oxidoreductase [Amycolatopsis acidicola]KAA9166537.1 Gfo/Idh/MocA family oxidoreductase [Amycolatopsis acidicola]